NCTCMPHQISQYNRKISGPIVDRIDLYVDVETVDHEKLLSQQSSEPSNTIQNRVLQARERQRQRFKSPLLTNAALSNREVKQHVALEDKAKMLLDQAAAKLDISARSYMRILKVAQTIADLESSESVQA